MSNIVTNVNTNVPVKGNGMALGITDGTNNGGLYRRELTNLINSATALLDKNSYGVAVGQTATQDITWDAKTITIGVVTDPTKSGIVGTVTRTQINCKFMIKY